MTELDKKLMKTTDLNAERLAKLKQLFPDIFTNEGNLNIDELKKIIDPELIKDTEKFEFRWFGKNEAKRTAFTSSQATFVYDEKRSVNPKNADGNLIIEGENLESLKCLLSAYRERIKCIYIDPPYNTGKDFVYSDKWNDDKQTYWEKIGVTNDGVKIDTNTDSSGRYHSNWLNLMYSRILLARQLLKNDGVMFISIDDNEVHHLRKICDEIFGEENFVECITWNKRIPKNDKGIGSIHEYIMIYTKDIAIKHEFIMYKDGLEEIERLLIKLKKDKVPLLKAEQEIRRFYKQKDYDRGITLYNSLNKEYRLWGKINMSWPNANTFGPRYEVQHPKTKKTVKIPERGWRWKKETFNESAGIKNGEYTDVIELSDGSFMCNNIWFGKDEKIQASSITYFDQVNTFLLRSILSMKSDGGIEVEKIFSGKSFFSYPKPSSLIKILIESCSSQDSDIILDFFAGSGTTAHAVMDLNQKDDSNRKFILVQLPELTPENSEAYKAGYKKISDITIERNKRVIEKENLKIGFKVYSLAKSNFPRVDFTPDTEKTEKENIELLKQYIIEKEAMFLQMADEKDIFDEVLLKNGFMLNYKLEQINDFTTNKVFVVKDEFKEFLICIDSKIKNTTLKELESYKDQIFICLEKAVDTTMKWNLKHLLGEKLIAF
ncbi:MAG: site-specific DNA-methyltransferase [Bacteroidetes bacterium]|nr:site-specific DNA-methyltransferase [Bacteroidota bacterium]